MSAVYVEVRVLSERFVLERSVQKSLSTTAQGCAEEMLLSTVQALVMETLWLIARGHAMETLRLMSAVYAVVWE